MLHSTIGVKVWCYYHKASHDLTCVVGPAIMPKGSRSRKCCYMSMSLDILSLNSFANQQFEGTFFLISANLRSWSEELGKALLLKHKSASAAHTAAYSSDTACKSRGGDSAATKRTEYQMQTGMQQPMLRKQYSRYSYAS